MGTTTVNNNAESLYQAYKHEATNYYNKQISMLDYSSVIGCIGRKEEAMDWVIELLNDIEDCSFIITDSLSCYISKRQACGALTEAQIQSCFRLVNSIIRIASQKEHLLQITERYTKESAIIKECDH